MKLSAASTYNGRDAFKYRAGWGVVALYERGAAPEVGSGEERSKSVCADVSFLSLPKRPKQINRSGERWVKGESVAKSSDSG